MDRRYEAMLAHEVAIKWLRPIHHNYVREVLLPRNSHAPVHFHSFRPGTEVVAHGVPMRELMTQRHWEIRAWILWTARPDDLIDGISPPIRDPFASSLVAPQIVAGQVCEPPYFGQVADIDIENERRIRGVVLAHWRDFERRYPPKAAPPKAAPIKRPWWRFW